MQYVPPIKQLLNVTPSDTVDLPFVSQMVYVGSAGNLTVADSYGKACLFTALPIGWYPLQLTRIFATGTAASALVIGR